MTPSFFISSSNSQIKWNYFKDCSHYSTFPSLSNLLPGFSRWKDENCTIPAILNMHSLQKKQGYCNCDGEADKTMPKEQEESHLNSHAITKNKKSGLLCGLLIFAPSRARKVESLPLATAAFSFPGDGKRSLLWFVAHTQSFWADNLLALVQFASHL